MAALQQLSLHSQHASPIILQVGAWCEPLFPYSELIESTSGLESYWNTELDTSTFLNSVTFSQNFDNPSDYSNTHLDYSNTSHENTVTQTNQHRESYLCLPKASLDNIEMLERWFEERTEQEPIRMIQDRVADGPKIRMNVTPNGIELALSNTFANYDKSLDQENNTKGGKKLPSLR